MVEAGIANEFPASSDGKYFYLVKIDVSKIERFDHMSIYNNPFFSKPMSFYLKPLYTT